MLKIEANPNYRKLNQNYLFSEIGKRVSRYAKEHPDKRIIRLGIGDVTLPITPAVTDAMHKAVDEMSQKGTFHGYAPEYGYDFLREAIAAYYAGHGVTLSPDEIFVSDGAKSDVGNLTDIFGDNEVLIPDPVYPVYLDSNLMCGRGVTFLSANRENGFLPMPDGLAPKPTLIYLCSPNNPTGAVYTRQQLTEWVKFAADTGSLILFDSAYEAYVQKGLPHSIYEIDGARECAIETCSLSKTAGFTGTRCAWSILPDALVTASGTKLATLWARRQATKFNGVAYVVQRGAQAALSQEGLAQSRKSIDYYMENARVLAELLTKKGIWFTGGVSSPYLWLKCPGTDDSWQFFDLLLDQAQVVGTPGAGFGKGGEGYFRLTAFGDKADTAEAAARLDALL